ncbi:serine/arginine repetitive matrix protein 2-like [Ylistrum balloti]|uniref:serine/arginine repetitive matrix protein 2-like n=1 Tax=Ylistrum balloti TaxID=509963 RepID=UPI002905C47B|nr:serine/arginine repetitive matrix protein 2-like [Ylistrum balloti]
MEMMVFDEIDANKDGCCLVRHKDTVYKVKVTFGQEIRKCDSVAVRLELEQVFRAVLHLSESDKQIPPIFTQHLMVKPLKKYWAICDKIGFQQNGQDLETSTYFFQFYVSERPVWKHTKNQLLYGKKIISTRESQCSRVRSGTVRRSSDDNVDSVRNHGDKGQQTSRKVNTDTGWTREKTTDVNVRNETRLLDRETEVGGNNDRQAESRQSKSTEQDKHQAPDGLAYSKKSNRGTSHRMEPGNEEIECRESETEIRTDIDGGEQKNKDTTGKDTTGKLKNVAMSSDSESEYQENARCLRRSARVCNKNNNTEDSRKHIGKSAVTELSQSGVTDLDITGEMKSVPRNQDGWKKKRKSTTANVDDIIGFSYKVNRFRAKISRKDNQSAKKRCHVLYRSGGRGHSPLMELPGVSDGTAKTTSIGKTSLSHRTAEMAINGKTTPSHGTVETANNGKTTPSHRTAKTSNNGRTSPPRRTVETANNGKASPSRMTTESANNGKTTPSRRTVETANNGKTTPSCRTVETANNGKTSPSQRTAKTSNNGKTSPSHRTAKTSNNGKTTPSRRTAETANNGKTTPSRRTVETANNGKASPPRRTVETANNRKASPRRRTAETANNGKTTPPRRTAETSNNGKTSPRRRTTETTNNGNRSRSSNIDNLVKNQTHSSTKAHEDLTSLIIESPINGNIDERPHDLTEDVDKNLQSLYAQRHNLRNGSKNRTKSQSNAQKSPTGSLVKASQKGLTRSQKPHTRSTESPKCRKSASLAKDVKIVTRSVTSSNGHRGFVRSGTPSINQRGQLRSALPTKRHRGQMRSATPSVGYGGRLRSATQTKRHRGPLMSATPTKGRRGRMRSATPSIGHGGHRSATFLKSNGCRMSSPSEESERLLRMRQPIQHGIQVADVDRYLVEQEELQEMSKLQKMASTHDQQSYYTRKRKQSGLWNYVDALIITPAKKIFKRS